MIDVELADELARAGLRWTPARGDHFVLPHRDMDEQVFVLSDMTIELHQFPAGDVIGFNGTVEWALDSVERHEALWIPREDQLREHLGARFAALRRDGDGYVCDVLAEGHVRPASEVQPLGRGASAEEAYARALLALLRLTVPV
jgi:hypothetical protein